VQPCEPPPPEDEQAAQQDEQHETDVHIDDRFCCPSEPHSRHRRTVKQDGVYLNQFKLSHPFNPKRTPSNMKAASTGRYPLEGLSISDTSHRDTEES
jgi:hypothetical protein